MTTDDSTPSWAVSSSNDPSAAGGGTTGGGRDSASALADAIARFGPTLTEDAARTRAVLADFGIPSREVAALAAAVADGAAAEITKPHPGQTTETVVARLAQSLQDRRAIDPAMAMWAVSTWARALGQPIAVTPLPDVAGGAAGAGAAAASTPGAGPVTSPGYPLASSPMGDPAAPGPPPPGPGGVGAFGAGAIGAGLGAGAAAAAGAGPGAEPPGPQPDERVTTPWGGSPQGGPPFMSPGAPPAPPPGAPPVTSPSPPFMSPGAPAAPPPGGGFGPPPTAPAGPPAWGAPPAPPLGGPPQGPATAPWSSPMPPPGYPPPPPPGLTPPYPPPPPPGKGKSKAPLIALLVVIGVLAVGLAGYGITKAVQNAGSSTTTTTSTSTSTTSTTTSTTTTSTTLGGSNNPPTTPDEKALQAKVPFADASCTALSASDRLDRSTASINCVPPDVSDASLEMSLYRSLADMNATYQEIRQELNIPSDSGKCADGPASEHSWTLNNVTKGRLLCFYGPFRSNATKLRVFWTNDDELILFKIIQDKQDFQLGYTRFQDWSG